MRMMNLRPHREILLTAFRQGWRDNGRWVIALLALLCIVPNVAAWWFQPAEAARLVTLCTAAALLQALWIAQFVSLQQQNHPTAARLVPRHVQHLRESLVALFIAIALATAALLGSALGHALAWGLGTGALMLAVAVMIRQPLLWAVWWVLPVTSGKWAHSAPWLAVRAQTLELHHAQPLLLGVGALVLMPLLASRFVRGGDAAHEAGYAQAVRRRQAMRMTSSGGEVLRHQGRAGQVFSALFLFIYRRWTPYLLATAKPTPRSALARAELALAPHNHWTAHLGSMLVFMGLAGLAWVFVLLVYGDLPWLQMAQGGGAFGLVYGLTMAALSPLISARASLYRSRREQAVLMLLPAMPRGAALNQRLARRQMLHYGLAWAFVATAIALSLGGDDSFGTRMVWSYLAACLPGGLLLWRDWSRMKPPSSLSVMLPILGILGLAGVLVGLGTWFALPTAGVVTAVIVATLALGAWRWQRLAGYPQALPVARQT